eukprot:3045970-Heterocapsa_arctica.AAC.1
MTRRAHVALPSAMPELRPPLPRASGLLGPVRRPRGTPLPRASCLKRVARGERIALARWRSGRLALSALDSIKHVEI